MIEANYCKLLEDVKRACEKSGRSFDSVKILIASKYFTFEELEVLIDCGHKYFGENTIQQGVEKKILYPNLAWDFIGHLQTNKVRLACENFDTIQSVDSWKLLSKIQEQSKKSQKIQKVFLQLNLTNAPTQYGFTIEEVEEMYPKSLELSHVQIDGLMMIGLKNFKKNSYNFFIELKYFFDKLQKAYKVPGFRELSMGMSEDFVEAIEAGSTIIRIGSFLKR